ncbi:hypothetical protein GCM10023166_02060 [Paeniglutamicibacter cryotolerans]|uniref:Transmembrane protein n=1 Tax=Paeniglutamicibacter cryotolerans TaxID=670079 RepID=A0A839QIJ1_9MICC|nr:hypothetical protein [Paeniglutamicibacter cryotolerans]
MEANEPRARVLWKVLPALGLLLVAWMLMWLAQSIPTVCALAFPCPAPDVRAAPAIIFGGLMLVPMLMLLVVSATGGSGYQWVSRVSYVALVSLAIVGLGTVLFSGGFGIPSF